MTADAARPLLKPWYRLARCEAGLTARFGDSVLLFEGVAARELVPVLLPLLDGTHTVEELVERLGAHTREAVENALGLLADHDLLLAEPVAHDGAAELLAATAYQPRDLTETSASVLGDGRLARELVRLLEQSGVGRVGSDWDAELVVAAPGRDAETQLREWNEAALERGLPWLALTPFDGSIAAVGPLVVPGETACHTCFRLRRWPDVHAASEEPLLSRWLSAPALDAVLAALAADAAVRWLATGDAPVVGGVLVVEVGERVVTRHAVFRVPRCPSCSPLARTAVLMPWGSSAAA